MHNFFITVPETTLPDGTIVPAFQVGQYACSRSKDGQAVVTAEGTPWVRINYRAAIEDCKAAGFALITERQWLAIAHNVAAQACNWTGGAVGEGELFQGLRNWMVEEAQPGTYQPTDESERRWLTLSNGERICDLNGNVYQWIFDDLQGDEEGVVAHPFAEASPSIKAPFERMQKGMGWRPQAGADWSGYALIRGGYWDSDSLAGVFRLSYVWPDREYDIVGFRCTKPIGL
ncbi:SUMF1/EgtB/PvdO family nonheme iron enzyme [Aromatoleum toluclasticum]|uniref:SUMF1/EgtB/PvdO family nonheme iron enzyme n=1 Tax=Aromatoleum toluclasticum TaxID=92003 RepID=UPI00037399E4|nr:SUMF1/EgtB/PvdO family nonheme iron enzyme [Aromatoleum toluclasticum]